MAYPHSPLMAELIVEAERELALADFERMRRHHQLPEELAAANGSVRSWIATRLAGLALRLDRPAAQGALGTY